VDIKMMDVENILAFGPHPFDFLSATPLPTHPEHPLKHLKYVIWNISNPI
jgi:hypothetical protein